VMPVAPQVLPVPGERRGHDRCRSVAAELQPGAAAQQSGLSNARRVRSGLATEIQTDCRAGTTCS